MPARRGLVLAFATLAVAVAAVMAVPQSRAAILEFFGIKGVKIERVEKLPPVPTQGSLILGVETTLEQAAERAGFRVRVPEELGEPDAVYFATVPRGGMVSLVYGDPDDPRALFTQFRGSFEEAIFKKVVTDATIEPVVGLGDVALWLEGEPHYFSYVDADGNFNSENVRLAGNVLLWELGELTLRLEADISRQEAVAIAHSVR